jgi:hypothetical protein
MECRAARVVFRAYGDRTQLLGQRPVLHEPVAKQLHKRDVGLQDVSAMVE